MDFNINQPLFDSEGYFLEEEVEQYLDTLFDLFAKSPEGKATLKGREVQWADMFVHMAINYLGMELRYLDQQFMRVVFYEIIPAKTMIDSDHVPEIIEEVKAFFEFLKREFKLPSADQCLKVLNQKNIVKRFTEELENPENFGPTKMIIQQMQASGVDMADQNQVQAFIDDYNQKMMEAMKPPPITEKAQKQYDKIKQLILDFYKEHLNEEYKEMTFKLLDAFFQDYPDRLEKGRAKSWAVAMVYTIGRINFLTDASFEPYMSSEDVRNHFGVSQSTVSSKSGELFDALDLMQLHPHWTVPSMLDQNPLVWMLPTSSGIIVDVRRLPREEQVKAYEMGMIPYIPADKE